MPMYPCRTIAAALTLCSLAHAGGLQNGWRAFRDPTVRDFGHQWSTVGDPGNEAYTYQPPLQLPRSIGRTNYKYRIMTREVTAREWFDFVQAYAPYIAQNAAGSSQLLGSNALIVFNGFNNDGVPQYTLNEANAGRPMIAGWRFAARYANWLHNAQADAAWAFETGVYDSGTFGATVNGNGTTVLTDQQERAEGAQFWIPSFDEWSKAGHWDQDRYGEGEGGWWQYPTTSDTAPVPGHPDFGGETNGGPFPPGQNRPFDVGSYPDVQSPWGLLDLSGGATEWLENINSPTVPNGRMLSGSSIYQTGLLPETWDRLGAFEHRNPSNTFGIRLASVIPSPGAVGALLALGAASCRRRRGGAWVRMSRASPSGRGAIGASDPGFRSATDLHPGLWASVRGRTLSGI